MSAQEPQGLRRGGPGEDRAGARLEEPAREDLPRLRVHVPPRPNRLRQALRSGLATLMPRALFLTNGPRSDRRVSLTFDDGPDPVNTPRVLDALAAEGIKATFFILGKHAERHPELVRRVAREGHDLGHHSYFHSDPPTTFFTDLLDEVRRTSTLIERIAGVRPLLFRPPLGKVTAGKLAGLWALRQTVVLWNVDPRDYRRRSPEEVVGWLRRHSFAGGDIVLLHDNLPNAAGAIPGIAATVRRAGLSFAPVSTWVPRAL
jgi:peptidoglycan-N-acetylglucosamine deacetylase